MFDKLVQTSVEAALTNPKNKDLQNAQAAGLGFGPADVQVGVTEPDSMSGIRR